MASTKLGSALKAVTQTDDARDLPVRDLLGIADDLQAGAKLTIDFSPAPDLGHPLVVLRVPESPIPAWFTTLTPRERDVARCVAGGLSK